MWKGSVAMPIDLCLLSSSVDEEDEEEEVDDEDIDDSDEEEECSIRRKAYAKFLPEVQKLLEETFKNSKVNLVVDRSELRCIVCPNPQWFKGWNALMKHAQTFKKKRIQQHRGYFDSIDEAIKAHDKANSQGQVVCANSRTASFDLEAANNHIIVWPPIVCIYGHAFQDGLDVQKAITDFLHKKAPEIRLPDFISAQCSEAFLLFRAEALGYLEAKLVAKLLHEHGKMLGIRGDLVTPRYMQKIDPQRNLVQWTEESEYIQVHLAHKKNKEEYDKERARLLEIQLQVDNLAENEMKFKERLERIKQRIEDKQREIESQKRRTEELERTHKQRMERLEASLQNEVKIFEATSAVRLKRYRDLLNENEKRMEEERLKRLREIDTLQKQLQSVTQDVKTMEKQKALEKELEVMQRTKNFIVKMERAEVEFNEMARKAETDLQERQHEEEMKLLEEAEKETEQLIQEWLSKQQEDKKGKEQITEDSINEVSECCMCMDELSPKNRAVLYPCGHATICLGCALLVYNEDRKLCPICREKIKKKPMLLPEIYF
ncbi:hypothetical protein KP509_11G037400 [Ceratopteris richardii]|uniref:RING-type domain-containing protein n=1 Tax=Ceratopteris richardii TaxID=49495 RepID=A0A8T2TUE7_CERRI|nr:hypothetical protein KP509_11G037400 [Ceratopteris richardii]